MEESERNKRYNDYVEAKIAKTHAWPSLFNAFWVGGIVCTIGQVINDLILLIFPAVASQSAWAYTLIILIFLASFLTGLGVFDKIGAYAGAGTIVPITGFSNSIASPAIEFKNEGIIFGMCAKMFIIAGPVIVSGTVASIIVGLLYLIF
ncbi:MAG: SpoVA/SpoVAEb family sporulation membrane protein [Clostridia bacterium]|nr:SpoVA/SpoVAEb family sporulation membrane protein [Clostridia bacterium]